MRPYAEVIGDPIDHSKSPALHGFWLEALGIEADYRSCLVRGPELGDYFTDRRNDPAWRGCNLTAPLKEQALPLVDELTDRASRIGAINLIRSRGGQLVGDNSDVDGITEALPEHRVAGNSAIVIGGGGAARAAIDRLVDLGAGEIRVLVRNPSRARCLRSFATPSCPVELHALNETTKFCDALVAVNASPLGMSNAPVPACLLAAIASMPAGGLLFDMVYEPLDTQFLQAARDNRITGVDGLTMLIGQARRAFELLFDVTPPTTHDAALRATLTGIPEGHCLVLVGLPGVGKTTIGAALAGRMGLKFFDSDQEIERLSGLPIPEFFARHGEQAFRKLEREVVAELIRADGRVVALGGGAFVDTGTREHVNRMATSIWLDTDLETIHSRLGNQPERPLLRKHERVLEELCQFRSPLYAEAQIRIAAGEFGETLEAIEEAVRTHVAMSVTKPWKTLHA